jgi:hypothetical protein
MADPKKLSPDAIALIERISTILLLLSAAVALQALHAPEGVIGTAVGAAASLIVPGGSRPRALVGAGAGAILGAIAGGWVPAGFA